MLHGDLEMVQNVPQGIRDVNKAINEARAVERFKETPPHKRVAVLVGGGPSLRYCLHEVKARQQNGAMVWTMNNTYAYLKANGIQPDAHVFLDSRKENVEFLIPDQLVTYYLDARCHPEMFEKAKDCKVVLFDLDAAGTGHTVGMKTLYLAAFSGFRVMYLYGFDSSYAEGKHHAYEQALNDKENVCEVSCHGRTFLTAPWMAHQADEFQYIAQSLADQGCVISVAGDGLLPHVARMMTQKIAEPYYL